MHRILDTLCLVILGTNTGLIFLVIWLGIWPDQSLAEFLKGWQAYAVFGVMISTPLVVISYFAGEDVKSRILKTTREKVLVPCFSTPGRSARTLVALGAALGGQVAFLLHFYRAAEQEYAKLLFDADPIAAQNHATLRLPVSRVDGFLWEVAEAAVQAEQRISRNENPDTTRAVVKRLAERRECFRPAIYRYLLAYGRMKAAMVLENLPEALAQARQMERMGRFLSEEDVRRGTFTQGQVYFADREGVLSGRRPDDSLAAAIRIFQNDDSTAAQRTLGGCYYLNNRVEEAMTVWERARAAASAKDTVERKRLLNNLAMGYAVLKQLATARKTVDEGLALPFEENREKERREQIRLLATKAAVCAELKDIATARVAWNEREKLKVDEGSACTFALQAQLLASECLNESKLERQMWVRAQLWFALAGAAGLKPAALEMDSPEARSALMSKAASKFNSCYRGLTFDTATVEKALNL